MRSLGCAFLFYKEATQKGFTNDEEIHDENPLPIDNTDEFAEFEAWEQTADKEMLAEWEAEFKETQEDLKKLPPEELAERYAFVHRLEYMGAVESMEEYHAQFNPPLDNPFPHLTPQQMAEAEKLRDTNCHHKPRCVCILTRFGSTQAKISAQKVIKSLAKAIAKEIKKGGPIIFFCHVNGLNKMKVADMILDYCSQNPNAHLICTINYTESLKYFSPLEKMLYYTIREKADYIKIMPESFALPFCPIEELWLMNQCSKLIVALQAAHGSQYYLLEQAQKHGMEIENCLGDASAMMCAN